MRRLFDQVMDAPAEARPSLARRLADGDDGLLSELERLIADEVSRTSALWNETGAADLLAEAADLSGEEFGSYRLAQRIGRGGMGEVYLASRSDGEFTRQVAIKVIQAGLDSATVVRRFRQERQILAALNHPGIATLLDAGVSPAGRPYIVMEYVDGQPITQWCARAALSVDARVRLVRAVCDAVHFAHRNLVIHRDLKPANILVTANGAVKLLDFGIAKIMRPPDESSDNTTVSGRALTPSYASPEQIRGDAVTTVSDVYSLGVILFELLTGRQPLALDGLSIAEAISRATTEDPPLPSRVVDEAAVVPVADRGKWRRRLAGDLDNIVLKAMRKEPDRRYGSAAELSEDLGRFLDGRPVEARVATIRYRAGKFVRRNRRSVAVAAVLVAAVGSGAIASVVQSQRLAVERGQARQRMVDVRELAASLLFEVHDAVADLPGATEARQLILARTIRNLEGLASQVVGDAELEWELAEAYLRTGLVQGDPTQASLGDIDGAATSFRRAIEIAERLVTAAPGDMRARRTLALSHEKLGDALAWTGDVDAGVSQAREALAGYRTIAATYPDSARHQLSVAISLVKLGDLSGNPNFPNLGKPEESLTHYEDARAILDGPVLVASPSWGTRRYGALVDERIGSLHRSGARYADARVAFERSLAVRQALATEEPANNDARRDVGVTRQNLCEVHLALDHASEALPLCRDAVAVYEELRRADPSNAQALRDVAIGSFSLAGARRASGDTVGALRALEDGAQLLREALDDEPSNVPNRVTLARMLARHTFFARDAGRPTPWAAAAMAELRRLKAEGRLSKDDEAMLGRLSGTGR